MKHIPILMYHALESREHVAGSKDSGEQLYVVKVEDFEKQLSFLQREGFQTVLLKDLISKYSLPDKTVVLTFDDGHISNYTLALPLLLKYRFCAEFFITTEWVGNDRYLSENQIQELYYSGMGIGSHGVSHAYLNGLDDTFLERELTESKNSVEMIIGKTVDSISAPGGRISRRVWEFAKNVGYSVLCTSKIGLAECGNVGLKPRVAIKKNTSLNEFSKIVSRNEKYYFQKAARSKVLNLLKSILGNHLYTKLHKTMSQFTS